jgi:hypothetical protein
LRQIALTAAVLALVGATVAAFVVTERLKLERSPSPPRASTDASRRRATARLTGRGSRSGSGSRTRSMRHRRPERQRRADTRLRRARGPRRRPVGLERALQRRSRSRETAPTACGSTSSEAAVPSSSRLRSSSTQVRPDPLARRLDDEDLP